MKCINAHRTRLSLAWITPLVIVLAGCGGESTGEGAGSGEATFGLDQGFNFTTGTVQKAEEYNKCDLYATSGGSHLKLKTGGETIVDNQPVNWFKTGGVTTKFSALAEVPSEKPTSGMYEPLLKAKAGVGFVLKNQTGAGYTRGWIRDATATSITIEYAPLD
jgi:hypothetical protein